jgi:hypothetical protein
MKYNKLILLVFSLILLSCSENRTNADKPEIFDKNKSFRIVDDRFLENGLLISGVSNLSKLHKNLQKIVDEINNFEEGFTIVYKLNLKRQKIYLTGYGIYNTKNKLVEIKVLNNENNAKTGSPVFVPSISPASPCPDGYPNLGTCSNFGSGTEDCLSDLAQDYFSSNLSSPGDCAQVMLTVGTFNTRACGESC